jgi:hypothetical protein
MRANHAKDCSNEPGLRISPCGTLPNAAAARRRAIRSPATATWAVQLTIGCGPPALGSLSRVSGAALAGAEAVTTARVTDFARR